MDLKTWLEKPGNNRSRLARKADVAPETIRSALAAKLTRPKVAEAISIATGGEVPAISMMAADSLQKSAEPEEPLSA